MNRESGPGSSIKTHDLSHRSCDQIFQVKLRRSAIVIRIKAWHCCALVAHSNTEVRQLVAAVRFRQAITYGVAGSLQLKRPSDRSVIGALLSNSREP
jgi:hypothetical protein